VLELVMHEALRDVAQLFVEEGQHGIQLLGSVSLLFHQIE
jgi:hypothetical protein